MNIYVGNLSYSIDNNALEAMFAPHGTVESASVITDRATGRLIDYVHLNGLNNVRNLSSDIGQESGTLGFNGLWATNRVRGLTIDSPLQGIVNQIILCLNPQNDTVDWTSYGPNNKANGASKQKEIEGRIPEDPITRLRRDLARAVKEERYEDAASIRDQLRIVPRAGDVLSLQDFDRGRRRHHDPGMDLEPERDEVNERLPVVSRTGQYAGSEIAQRLPVPQRKLEPDPRLPDFDGRLTGRDAGDPDRRHAIRQRAFPPPRSGDKGRRDCAFPRARGRGRRRRS